MNIYIHLSKRSDVMNIYTHLSKCPVLKNIYVHLSKLGRPTQLILEFLVEYLCGCVRL